MKFTGDFKILFYKNVEAFLSAENILNESYIFIANDKNPFCEITGCNKNVYKAINVLQNKSNNVILVDTHEGYQISNYNNMLGRFDCDGIVFHGRMSNTVKGWLQRTSLNSLFKLSMNMGYGYELKCFEKNSIRIKVLIPTKYPITYIESIEYKSIDKKKFDPVIIHNEKQAREVLNYYGVKQVMYGFSFNYSKIHNITINEITDKYVILMNDDVEIINNSLHKFFNIIDYFDTIAVVGSKLLFKDGTIQHAGVKFDNGDPSHLGRCRTQNTVKQSGQYLYCNAVTFALCLIRVDIYKKLGGMDEIFPLSYNDTDYCIRCKKIGYDVLYNPEVEAFHYESKTRGNGDPNEGRYLKIFKDRHLEFLNRRQE